MVLAISFNAMFADVVPPEWRAQVVGRRNALLAVASTAASLGGGKLLGLLPEPLNYQVLFTIGAIGATFLVAISSGRSTARRPDRRFADDRERPGQPIFALAQPLIIREVLRLDAIRSRFGLLMLAYLVFYVAQFTAIPLQPVFWVQTLKLTDFEIGVGNALFYLTLMVGSLALAPLTARAGMNRPRPSARSCTVCIRSSRPRRRMPGCSISSRCWAA